MTYTSTPTLSEIRAQLAARLDDSSQVFFTEIELNSYIQESIRFFNSAAMYFRDRGVLSTVAGTSIYDVTILTKDTENILQRTLTDRDIVNDIQRHLLEPVTSDWDTGWTGTDMFTLASVTKAVQRRRDQFLVETGLVLTISEIDVPDAPIGRVPLSDLITDVKRAAWLSYDSNGNPDRYTNLWKTDELGLASYMPGWSLTPNKPKAYSTIATPQVQLQLAPIPQDIGRLHLITVNAGTTLDTTTGVLLGIPDDFAWAVKYGAMADLLGQEGQAHDSLRAEYCEQRFRDGIELGKIAISVLRVELNGRPKPVSDLFSFDARNPTWQSAKASTRGTPNITAIVGHNYIALTPTPDNVYSVTCDVIRNAVVPIADDDHVQVGMEYLADILDYAQHIAAFKCGGAEFQATLPQYEGMMKTCASYNQRLRDASRNFDALKEKKEEKAA